MDTLKQEAFQVISDMPDSSNLEDIMYQIYVLDKVRRGREAVESGDTVSIDDLRKEIEIW